jgi:hypothetical protein
MACRLCRNCSAVEKSGQPDAASIANDPRGSIAIHRVAGIGQHSIVALVTRRTGVAAGPFRTFIGYWFGR